MVIGSLFLISMSNLSTVSSSLQSIGHAGNAANAAAQSGLGYGIYQRIKPGVTLATAVEGGVASISTAIAATPCDVTYRSTPASCAGDCTFTVSSLAVCYGGSQFQAIRWLKQDVRAFLLPSDSYQVAPGSRANVAFLFNPGFGAAAGGTVVTITGIGFTGATAATFAGAAGTGFTVNSDTSVTVTTPVYGGALPKRADVTITTPAGNITFPGSFTYQ